MGRSDERLFDHAALGSVAPKRRKLPIVVLLGTDALEV